MSELVVNEWRRHGRGRLYVVDPAINETVGYYDRASGTLIMDDEARTYEAAAALRPFLVGALPEAAVESLLERAAPAGADLSENKAGSAAAARARELGPRGFQRLATRVLGLRTAAGSWDLGAEGERIVSKRLERLKRAGWNVLHAVPLRSGADIDHVVIGPPGVFTVNTKHHQDAVIRVGDHVLWVDGRQTQYLRDSRHEAQSAERRLSQAYGAHVDVLPVLAFVGSSVATQVTGGSRVMVTSGERIDQEFAAMPGVLTTRERERIYNLARQPALWLA